MEKNIEKKLKEIISLLSDNNIDLNKPVINDLIHQLIKKNPYYNSVHYNNETNEYEIILDSNITLKGNLGIIFKESQINDRNITTDQISYCNQNNNCKNVLKEKYCKFYHPHSELLKLKNNNLISEEYFNTMIQYQKNYHPKSWLYKPEYKKNSLRKIGSKNNLKTDIFMLLNNPDRKIIIEEFKSQIIHDILLLKEIYKYDT